MKASERIKWLYREKTSFRGEDEVDDNECILAMFDSILHYLDEKNI